MLDYDFLDEDDSAFPKISRGKLESHGTACAGEIAMAKNNFCGVGIAFKSRITGM